LNKLDISFLIIIVVILAGAVTLGIVFRRKLIAFFVLRILRSAVLIIFLILLIIVALGSISLCLCESSNEEGYFESIPESAWSILVYLFSGFEGRSPETTEGKVIVILIFLAGISVMGLIYGRITAALIKLESLEGAIMKYTDLRDHYIICNYSPKALGIIRELRSSGNEKIVVISNEGKRPETEGRPSGEVFKDVLFCTGDPYDVDVLAAADSEYAKAIIILADEEAEDPDGLSALACIAVVERFRQVKEKTDKNVEKPHIVVEALNHDKMEHMRYAGGSEVVCHSDFGLNLLAQAAITKGLTTVFDRLTSFSKETNEIYIIDYGDCPKELHGKNYAEINHYLADHGDKRGKPVTPIGLWRGETFYLNPRRDKDEVWSAFLEGDKLVVLAYERPKF